MNAFGKIGGGTVTLSSPVEIEWSIQLLEDKDWLIVRPLTLCWLKYLKSSVLIKHTLEKKGSLTDSGMDLWEVVLSVSDELLYIKMKDIQCVCDPTWSTKAAGGQSSEV